MIQDSAAQTSPVIKGVTALVLIVTMIISILGWQLPHGWPLLYIVGPLLIALALVCYFRAPVAYEITPDNRLIIRFRLGSKVFSPVKSIRVSENSFSLFTIRLLGNGGYFAVTGLFWNREMGRFRAYVTNLKKIVIVELQDGKKIIISPENIQAWG